MVGDLARGDQPHPDFSLGFQVPGDQSSARLQPRAWQRGTASSKLRIPSPPRPRLRHDQNLRVASTQAGSPKFARPRSTAVRPAGQALGNRASGCSLGLPQSP